MKILNIARSILPLSAGHVPCTTQQRQKNGGCRRPQDRSTLLNNVPIRGPTYSKFPSAVGKSIDGLRHDKPKYRQFDAPSWAGQTHESRQLTRGPWARLSTSHRLLTLPLPVQYILRELPHFAENEIMVRRRLHKVPQLLSHLTARNRVKCSRIKRITDL